MAKTSTFFKILQSEKNHCEANILALLAWEEVKFGSHAWEKGTNLSHALILIKCNSLVQAIAFSQGIVTCWEVYL